MANFLFKDGIARILDRSHSHTHDMEAQTFKVRLLTTAITKANVSDATTFTFSSPTITFVGVTGQTATEFTGTNAAIKTLADEAWVLSAGTGGTGDDGFVFLEATDITWSALGASGESKVVGALLYEDDSSTFRPLAYYDFEVEPDGSDVTLQWGNVTGATPSGAAKGVVFKVT